MKYFVVQGYSNEKAEEVGPLSFKNDFHISSFN